MIRTELIRPIPELLRTQAETQGAKIVFSDAACAISYADLAERTARLAGHLAELGIRKGDRVVILMNNSVETVESYYAINRASAVAVPVNPRCADAELAHILDDSDAVAVLSDRHHRDQLARVRPGGHDLLTVFAGLGRSAADASGGTVSYDELVMNPAPQPPRDDLGLDDVAWLLYTSGTTGLPKGVMSTQRNCLWSVAACYGPILGLSQADRVLWPMPLFHSLAHVLCVHGIIATGASAHIMTGLAAEDIAEQLRAETFTMLVGVPAMYYYLLQTSPDDVLDLASLRVCLVTGSVAPASLRESFERAFGVRLVDSYGSTETCGAITMSRPEIDVPAGSCGQPVPGLALRLVDAESGQDAGAGEEGEVWVRGPSVMARYHSPDGAGRPGVSALTPEGWYRTGDLARQDENGFLTISGRIKDLIIRGGENIHPAEIEAAVHSVACVAEAAAAGKPHDVLGEVPVVFVVPSGHGELDTDQVFAACEERLAYYKVPEEIYEVSELPRTGSGKMMRHNLLSGAARLRATRAKPRLPERAPSGGSSHEPQRLRRLLATASPQEQSRVLLDLVRAEVADLMGRTGPGDVAPGKAFKELGFDSVGAVALCGRLNAAAGLRLSAMVVFDYPSPAVLAEHLRAELLGAPAKGPALPPKAPADEPIAIVGMSCALPGGVRSPEDLWRLVLAGGDAVGPFPADRGWDLARASGGRFDVAGRLAACELADGRYSRSL